MFRAAHRSSSEAVNCICSLWFIYPCGDRPLSRLSGKCHFPQYHSFSPTHSYTTNVALYCSIPVSAPHTATLQMLHCTAVSQFQHHTQLYYKCCTVLQYHSFSTTHSYTPNVALYCSITVSAPHTAILQMLHCPAVSQFQHHTQLYYKCCTVLQYHSFSTTHSYTPNVALYCSIPASAPHSATLQMLHCTAVSQFQPHTQLYYKCCTVLQYPSFSTTHSYTPNVALYCSITVSAPHTATLQMLHCTAVSKFHPHTHLHSKCCSVLQYQSFSPTHS
jgi:hypothetical protein